MTSESLSLKWQRRGIFFDYLPNTRKSRYSIAEFSNTPFNLPPTEYDSDGTKSEEALESTTNK